MQENEMITEETRDRPWRSTSGERCVLRRATIVLSTVAVLGAGAVPIAAAALASVSPVATVTDSDAETTAVELLKSTYFNDVDTKNWLALRQLFTPNAVVDTTGSFGPYFPDRDSFIAFTSLTLSAINTRHQGYDPQIDLTSDTTASAVWTMQDRLSLAGLVTIHGYGHYTDKYEEVDGQWRITYSKLTRTGFALEFPAFQNFVNGLGNAYKSGGPLAALLYVGPGIVNIPVSAVKKFVGAIASNLGGAPAKAQPITVPPGSTGVTTEPPGVTTVPSTATATTSSAKTFTLRTSPASTKSSGSNTTPSAPNIAGSTAKAVQSIEPGATQSAVEGKPQMGTAGAAATSPRTHDGAAPDAPSTPSRSTPHEGADHKSVDNAKSESGHSGGSRHR
jgi:hypothetical protein